MGALTNIFKVLDIFYPFSTQNVCAVTVTVTAKRPHVIRMDATLGQVGHGQGGPPPEAAGHPAGPKPRVGRGGGVIFGREGGDLK